METESHYRRLVTAISSRDVYNTCSYDALRFADETSCRAPCRGFPDVQREASQIRKPTISFVTFGCAWASMKGFRWKRMNLFITNPDPVLQELRALVIENIFLRVVVFPEAGAKVWQIHYKPLSADLLWNHPHMPVERRPFRKARVEFRCSIGEWPGPL